jgi:thiol:disulfide interchange protein
VVAHTLWTSAAPAMTYPLFAEEWHLTHTVTYVSLGAVALLLGAVATAHGLGFAVDLGAGVIALFSVITVALVAMTRAGSFQIAIPSKSEGRPHD